MRILIRGAEFLNKGAEAMLRTVQAEIKRRIPSAEFFLWGCHQTEMAMASGVTPIVSPNFRDERRSKLSPRRLRQLTWYCSQLVRGGNLQDVCCLFSRHRLSSRAYQRFLECMPVQMDAFLDISGYAYSNVDAFRSVKPILNYCAARELPIVFLPQAWGRFSNETAKHRLRSILTGNRTLFYARDAQSASHLEEAMGKHRGTIPPTPDTAFLFHGGTGKQGHHVLLQMGCSCERPVVGISPNMRVYERIAGKNQQNAYVKMVVELARYCLNNHKVDLVLQPNEAKENGFEPDDRYLCQLIQTDVGCPNHCFSTRARLSAEETKALIGQFEFLVSSRFHSSIFALSQGIPTMAIGWSHKYRELMKDFDASDNVIELEHIDIAHCITMFERAWNTRHEQSRSILDKLRETHIAVSRMFDDVADFLMAKV